MGEKSSAAEPAIRPPFRIGEFTVDPTAGVLSSHAGREQLDPKVMGVLLLLAERAGTVVLRDELLERVWPGVIVGDDALSRCVYQLRRHFVQVGGVERGKTLIQTFPKRGYQLNCAPPADLRALPAPTDESRVVGDSDTSSPAADSRPPASVRQLRVSWSALAAAATILVVISLVYLLPADSFDPTSKKATAEAPSIAVLPFVNMSSDEESEHFSDGLTEEMINKLTRIRGLEVVARSSSFQFKGQRLSASELAQSLRVNHVLEGSVRRSGDRLRVSASLIDAGRGTHIWSETFDRDFGDIFQIQEDIAFAVAAALKVSLIDADADRIRQRGTNDAEAYRLYMIALADLLGRTSTSDPAQVKHWLETAIERDPDFALAHAALSRYYLLHGDTLTDPQERENLGMAAAERAIALDPASSEAFHARANFTFLRYRDHGRYEDYVDGRIDIQRAVELDPGNSLAYEDYGRWVAWHEPDLAATLLERAIQLDILCTTPNFMIAMLLGARGNLEAGRKRCLDLLERAPNAAVCTMAIGTLETYYGNLEEAIDRLQAVEKIVGSPARLQLWSIHMSLGDPEGARRWLDFGPRPSERALAEAAHFAMNGRYDQAFLVLDQYRQKARHDVDVPAAKFALIGGNPRKALEIFEQRLPDVVAGIEPVTARNVLPAVDIATALSGVGELDEASILLERIAAYLDGPDALRLPMFAFQRARVHALTGAPDAAFDALDQAYRAGLRTTWALDVRPQDFRYIDPIEADPALERLRGDPRLASWFARLRADNARKLERLKSRMVAKVPPGP